MNPKKLIEGLRLPPLRIFESGKTVDTKEDFLLRRQEIKKILETEIYGVRPKRYPTESVVETEVNENAYAAKAIEKHVNLNINIDGRIFTLPFIMALPKNKKNVPFILLLNFRRDVPDKHLPAEEIIDNGFGFLSVCYKDITSDDGDFSNGVYPFFRVSENDPTAPGKIAVWSWAASQIMDYLQTVEDIDKNSIAIAGHSRLGKTALVTGALDDRFSFVYSNDSGCSGAALTRGKDGEQVADITKAFPYWFCDNYLKYKDDHGSLPFDQHFLLALVAPRFLYVASAIEDIWADPVSEYLGCLAASEAYEYFHKKGLGGYYGINGEKPFFTHSGSIGYHLREGSHYLSRLDWIMFMKFMKEKI